MFVCGWREQFEDAAHRIASVKTSMDVLEEEHHSDFILDDVLTTTKAKVVFGPGKMPQIAQRHDALFLHGHNSGHDSSACVAPVTACQPQGAPS